MRKINKQQLLSFVIVEGMAIFAIVHGLSYQIGTLSNMGPGFFPVALGVLMMITGVFLLFSVDPDVHDDDDEGRPSAKSIVKERSRTFLIILMSVICFIVIGNNFGLVPGTFLLCFIASFADKQNSIRSALVISVMLTLVCVAVFSWFLRIPFPLFGAI